MIKQKSLNPFIALLITTLLAVSASADPILKIVDDSANYGIEATINNSGTEIITLSEKLLSVWDANTGKLIKEAPFPPMTSTAGQFGPVLDISLDDKYALISALPYDAHLWNLDNLTIVQRYSAPFEYSSTVPGVWAGAISPDGKYSVTHNSYGILQVWENESGKEIRQHKYDGSFAKDMQFMPDGKNVFVEASYPTILDPFTGEIHRKFPGAFSSFLSNDKTKLFLVDNEERRLNLYNVNDGSLIRVLTEQKYDKQRKLAVSPDMKYILFGGVDNEEKNLYFPRVFMDASNGKVLRQVETDRSAGKNSPNSNDNGVAFFPDGKRFITMNGNTVYVWDISEFTSAVQGSDEIKQ